MRDLANAQAAMVHAQAAAAHLATLAAERAALELELADWRELAADLGRDGLHADLVDSAAPTPTALSNDLLRSAGVTRWTVRFDTSTIDDHGEATPGYPILVHDELTGETREARTLSGGESVLVGSAVANAVAAVACSRASIEGPVLVRDESGAALDPTNERAWCAMLRRTAAIVGASRVLVITHSPALRALCDSTLWVANGTLTEGAEQV